MNKVRTVDSTLPYYFIPLPAMPTDNRTLEQFLIQLDSNRDDWGVYVDSCDPVNDWRMGFNEFDYGNRVYIGSLARMSFTQDPQEALRAVLHERLGRSIGWVFYQDRQVLVNVAAIMKAFNDPSSPMCPQFRSFLQGSIKELAQEWKEKDVRTFISYSLPNIINHHASKLQPVFS